LHHRAQSLEIPVTLLNETPNSIRRVTRCKIHPADNACDRRMMAGEIKKDIQAVYKAGMEINYLPSMPSDASIYDKPLK